MQPGWFIFNSFPFGVVFGADVDSHIWHEYKYTLSATVVNKLKTPPVIEATEGGIMGVMMCNVRVQRFRFA